MRLCCLKRWSNVSGYGFHLQEEKGRPGHYVGMVDGGTPAHASGLREGDKVIEVNGVNIEERSHSEVVDLIGKSAKAVRILVVTDDVYEYFQNKKIRINESMNHIKVIECPSHMVPVGKQYPMTLNCNLFLVHSMKIVGCDSVEENCTRLLRWIVNRLIRSQ